MLTHKGTQTIETSRLILRRAIREDAEPMFRNWASDSEVTKYLTWPTHSNTTVSEMVIGSWLQEYERDNYYQWMIVLKEIGEPIGSISVVRQNDHVQEAEIGYCIGGTDQYPLSFHTLSVSIRVSRSAGATEARTSDLPVR